MMNKEECEKMIEKLPMLIPAKEEYGYGCSMSEFEEAINFVNELYKQLYDPQPYKFEELKEGMWVWDNNRQSVIKVIGFYGVNIHVQFGIGVYKKDCYIEFEENRFYPVAKAMEGFENVK